MTRVYGVLALTIGAAAPFARAIAQHPAGGMSHPHGGIMYHAPQWSPDGEWIVVSANVDGDTEIYLIRPDGSALRQLTRNTVPDDIARWSADGRRVIFESERSGQAAQYSMNLAGGDVRPEPLDSVTARSPDGTLLLFESVREGRGRLFTMTAQRTGAREITKAPRHAEQGTFSPDGRWVVFEQRDAMHEKIERSDIVLARPDGSEARVIASGTDPKWSRDGTLILFKTFDDATQQLWISTVTAKGTDLRRLAPGVHPSWSPDNTQIAFMRERADGGADVWIIGTDGNGARCITCTAPFR